MRRVRVFSQAILLLFSGLIAASGQNTTVDGTLKVGANADVTYREDAGKYVAISVRVS